MATVTEEQLDRIEEKLDRLKRRADEAYWISLGALRSVSGRDSAERYAETVRRYCTPMAERFQQGTPVYEADLGRDGADRLIEVDVLTLEEAARMPRERLAACEGVGRVTLAALDAALAERGLSWAEAS